MSDLFPFRHRSSTHKASSQLARTEPKAVQVWVRKPSRWQLPLPLVKRGLKLGGITVGLIGSGGLVVLCLWASVVFILRPHPPRWLAQTVPYFSGGWSDQPVQSLEEIEAELQAQGRTAGDLSNLSNLGDNRQLDNLRLLPIRGMRSSCTRDCEAIVELRLYRVQPRGKQDLSLQLLDQLEIQGPPEEQVIDPVWQANVGIVGSTHPLPLSEIKSLQEEELPGVWLTLTGRWQHQGSPILYGQVLHVDLQTLRINSLLNWSSPPGRLPVWQNLDGEGLPELVVSQNVGLEPHFSLYSVANTTAAVAVRLKEISLSQLPLLQATHEALYHNALFLAQHGLWSDAQEQFAELKTQLADQWPQELEQQFQLITLHARISQNLAERDWSRPSQKLLALLLDGRWEIALDAMGTSQTYFETAVLPLLQRDSSRLWQRLTASLQVTPTEKAARIWGALLLLAKEDKEAALEWLSQNQNAPLKTEFEALLAEIQPEEETETEDSRTVTVSNQADQSDTTESEAFNNDTVMVEGLFGTARLLASPNPAEWIRPPEAPELILSAGQQWYEVTLQAGNTNKQWSRRIEFPDTTSPEAMAAFWQTLGFDTSTVLHLVSESAGTPQAVQVRAMQWQAGTIRLLASGMPTQATGPWAAATPTQWITPRQVRTQSLAQLSQERPQLGDRLLDTISNHLGVDATLLSSTLQEQTTNENLITVRRVDFTGNQETDLLLTLDPKAWAHTNTPLAIQETVYMVVSSRGELLFSNLWESGSQTLMGWLTPDAGATALVVSQEGTYRLLVWSPQQQQFR